ncbi:unnamed protein product [Didymodactylos carnosus]|uniref:Uncharacterized protein n=1 Tax=Didymodactylos carnosus TaxID=1234261 RepID=A0A815IQH4_9BILA|nr:unnamed protein product [Didymodactylos carnosus]CAF4253717.1 unnamed protein product [Didymodactylos carnosus]
MDGTLISNKHIVAISIDCVEGDRDCQSPKICSVKYVRLKKKDIPIKLKLGGDFMNAVYVFGLAGVQSNFPCIFCTQHKKEMQLRRHQHNSGFYRQLSNSSLLNRQLVHPHNLARPPVQFALPHAPRLLSIRPLIQRFVFCGAIANRG